jgi:hypothetical protein
MLEAVAHAWHRDYPALCLDMQQLGFIPLGTDVVPLAKRIPALMDPWLDGGGVKNFDPDEALEMMLEVQQEFPYITLPPSFRSIGRAVSLLEGIALSTNADFSIVEAMFPMAVERLLTDDSPQMEAVLEYLIYGKGGREAGVFEAKRVIEVVEALKVTVEVATAEAAARAANEAAVAARKEAARPPPDAVHFLPETSEAAFASARRSLPPSPGTGVSPAAARAAAVAAAAAEGERAGGEGIGDSIWPKGGARGGFGFAAWTRAAAPRVGSAGLLGSSVRLVMRAAAAVVAVPVAAVSSAAGAATRAAGGAPSTSAKATTTTFAAAADAADAYEASAAASPRSAAAAEGDVARARARAGAQAAAGAGLRGSFDEAASDVAAAAARRVSPSSSFAPSRSSPPPLAVEDIANTVESVNALGKGDVNSEVARTRDMLQVALRNKFMRRVLVEEMVRGAEAVVRCQLADGAAALGLGSLRVPVPTFLLTAFGRSSGGSNGGGPKP